MLGVRKLGQAIQPGVVLEAVFRHIGDEHGGLGGDQEKLFDREFFFFAEINRAHRLGVIQRRLATLQNSHEFGGLFVAGARGFLVPVQCFFHTAQVGQTQLGLNHFNVRNGVHFAGHVDHVVVFKAAHHIHNRIGFADMRQKLVT